MNCLPVIDADSQIIKLPKLEPEEELPPVYQDPLLGTDLITIVNLHHQSYDYT